LFSGLAFTGVIYAILLQRKELQLQRRELELTRDELEGQKLALTAQNKTLEKQNFENTFFQLLKVLNDIIGAIDLRHPSSQVVTQGRDCFKVFCQQRLRSIWNGSKPAGTERERINKVYLAFYADNGAEIGHYFRTLYNLVKFVDRSDVTDKRFYTNLIRAQLSSYELALIFYNCLSDLGSEKFKPLLQQYALLKTLPRDQLFNPTDHVSLYETPAYGV
jgi:hypothetical protein